MRALIFGVWSLAGVLIPRIAQTDPRATPPPDRTSDAVRESPDRQDAAPGYLHSFGAVSFGRGMRFNNPYRLGTVLGGSAESLSLTASYLDLALGFSLGEPDRLRHGAVGHFSTALEGVPQEVVGLSYLLVLPVGRDFLLLGRAGIPVVLRPDLTAGFELGLSGALMITGGLGVMAELVSSLFLGAATWEHDPSLLPVLSLQLGAYAEYEVLP